MKSITFACKKTLPLAPEEIANQILDVEKWPEFQGYGPIPGIKTAEFEIRTANIVGSRIRVTNLDGSTAAPAGIFFEGFGNVCDVGDRFRLQTAQRHR